MCNVDPEWCEEGRKKKKKNGGEGGYLYFPVAEGREERG
jgi:hypothetical protein